MSPAAYYNEHDSKAAAWLRELVKRGLIARGEVDERDIQAVQPGDLTGFTQCHFFAGIGGWSYALRLAGWADETPVWTGSCPCQPFSVAGKGEGFSDPRHLWPDWFRLLRECRPSVVFGEQSPSPAGRRWLDLVAADLEGAGYAFGAADLPACSVGAPHIRQRLWFVADSSRNECRPRGRRAAVEGRTEPRRAPVEPSGLRSGDGLGDPGCTGLARRSRQSRDDGGELPAVERAGGPVGGVEHAAGTGPLPGAHAGVSGAEARGVPERGRLRGGPAGPDGACRLADAELQPGCPEYGHEPGRRAAAGAEHGAEPRSGSEAGGPGPTDGFWRAADWLLCTDGKWRPVGPGTFPLAAGAPARVVRLRGYGNCLAAPLAAEFIAAYLEARGGLTL